MASVEGEGKQGEVRSTKRPHVKTEKMQEFLSMRHKDVEGSPQKQLKCPKHGCDKVLTSSPGLRYHMRTHTGLERPYQCIRCFKTFKSANGLKYHTMKTKCEDRGEYTAAVNLKHVFDLEPSAEDCTSDDEIKLHDMEPMESNIFMEQQTVDIDFHSQSSQDENMSSEDMSADEDAGSSWLQQLAIIATSPQSPLLQKEHSFSPPAGSSSTAMNTLEYTKPAQSTSRSKDHVDNHRDDGEAGVSSSSPFPSQTTSDSNGNWSHLWPSAIWQCFIKGTRVRFTSGCKQDWQLVEDLAYTESLKEQASQTKTHSYAPHGLRLLHIEESRLSMDGNSNGGKSIMRLRFTPDLEGQPEVVAECLPDHPFFVKDKGWSSFHPGSTADRYGIPCNELQVKDVCLPHDHAEATFTVDVIESFKSYDFTPMDSSAVFALSSMAQQKRDLELSPRSCPSSPSKKRSTRGSSSENKAKRPMNAFMLFAKKFRMEYNQMYPGKDNRAISVMLGDKWKKMEGEERKQYAQEAKALAEQHKKMHPDCWKRKRNPSGSGDTLT